MKNNKLKSIINIIFSLLFSSLLFSNNLYAKNVDLDKAKQVALNVFSKESGLSKKSIVIKNVIPFKNKGELVFRIFNLSPKGYIVVSAEDNTIPILGYGLDSNFSFDDAPPALLSLLDEYKNEILYIKEKGLKADENIINKWATYSSPEYISLKSYSPGTWLLNTKWGQKYGYNRFCPKDPDSGKLSPVGCVPVAMGQVLRYWNCRVFPDNTSHYYCDSIQDWLTVHFYNESYNWGIMHDEQSDDENAKLLYHCGVAAKAQYTDNGTSASFWHAASGLYNYFGFYYSSPKAKKDYEPTWINMLKAEIDAYRPVLYTGAKNDTTPGHAWVVDGYKPDNTFHCNWGWDGDYNNDWYPLDDLTPGSSHDYNSGQMAIMNIRPKLDACSGIPGASIVCSSNESYSVTIPTWASVVWSKSSNLNQVGGNTGTTYTVNKGYSGQGHITATIKNSHGYTFLTRTKGVWVGDPLPSDISLVVMDNLTGQQVSQDMMCPNTGYILICQNSNNQCNTSNYSWFLPYGMSLISTSGNTAYINTNSSPGGVLTVKAQTCCSANATIMSEVLATDGDDCDGWYMSFSPNPTTGETTLSIEFASEELGLKSVPLEPVFDENTEWEFEVYNPNQTVKEKRTNLKGSSTTIQTQSWKEGVYVVRVKFKPDGKTEKILTGKLMVKK